MLNICDHLLVVYFSISTFHSRLRKKDRTRPSNRKLARPITIIWLFHLGDFWLTQTYCGAQKMFSRFSFCGENHCKMCRRNCGSSFSRITRKQCPRKTVWIQVSNSIFMISFFGRTNLVTAAAAVEDFRIQEFVFQLILFEYTDC